jgi:hypothetical protein
MRRALFGPLGMPIRELSNLDLLAADRDGRSC